MSRVPAEIPFKYKLWFPPARIPYCLCPSKATAVPHLIYTDILRMAGTLTAKETR